MMTLYHATTPKKLARYESSGAIFKPVRGFRNAAAARLWAKRTGRTIILRVEADRPHKLPDHHNKLGQAWWNDADVKEWEEL